LLKGRKKLQGEVETEEGGPDNTNGKRRGGTTAGGKGKGKEKKKKGEREKEAGEAQRTWKKWWGEKKKIGRESRGRG